MDSADLLKTLQGKRKIIFFDLKDESESNLESKEKPETPFFPDEFFPDELTIGIEEHANLVPSLANIKPSKKGHEL